MIEQLNEIRDLVDELNLYRKAYYEDNKPIVPDKVYDNMYDKLVQMEKATGIILANSPTQTVGYEVINKLEKTIHTIPLRSLDKTKDIKELNKFINSKKSIQMVKADGLTIELIYKNGQLYQASTRGNGNIGEIVTHNVKTFKNLPLTIPFKGTLKIAGEAIINKANFKSINENLSEEEKYATPRNLVAGSVRQLDSKICFERRVEFFAFNILECSESLSDSKYERFLWLMQLGFNIIPVIKQDKGHLIDKYNFDLLTDLADFHNIPYDGLVFSFDSVKYSESLGETSHHPLHSIAFKFEDESVKTILKDIEWSVGRTGVITPVAIFNPVEIGGTQVGRASVHNLSIVEDLELGIGDEISIIKANMIIPQIEENFTRSNNITIPLKCPVCGSNVIIEQLNDSKVLRCTNDYCTAKKLKKFAHFVSRDAMNIEGLSEATIEKLINKGLLHTLTDIYRLYEYENIIINMEGFGERSFEKLTSAIGKSRNIEMANFIYALGIDQIGLGGAKRLANYFNNDINAFLNANYYNFLDIPDFGAITAQAIYDHFKNLSNHNEILDLLTEITIKKPEISREEILKGIKDNPFKGTKVYATGTFANYKKDEIQKYLESLGAEFAAGYAKSLNYLIVGSVKGSGKEAKAKADGIPILQENEFMEMIKKID